MTKHYLNQCWTDSLTHICGTRGGWLSQHPWRSLNKNRVTAMSDTTTLRPSLEDVVESPWRPCNQCHLQLKRLVARSLMFENSNPLLYDQVNNKEKIKDTHYWPFLEGIHSWPVDPPHKGSVRQKFITLSCVGDFFHPDIHSSSPKFSYMCQGSLYFATHLNVPVSQKNMLYP